MNKWVLCRDNSTGDYFIIFGEDNAAKCEFSSIIEVYESVFLAFSAMEALKGVKTE